MKMIEGKKIALLCNYELLPDRVGGMDHFFWLFDQKCKDHDIHIDWFFPNVSNHGAYPNLTLKEGNRQNIESFFLKTCTDNDHDYSHVITHFAELCTPFYYKLKQVSNAKIIAIDHNPRPIKGYPIRKKVEKKVKGILFSKYIDLFVGVSDYTVNEILKDFGNHLNKKTKTIYNGVLIEGIKVRTNRSVMKPTFLVASHLRESKGIQDLIEAVSLLPEPIKNEIKIDIYGDGPYKEVLVQKVQENKLTNAFRFMGSRPNLSELFYKYDYMLQPTHMECFSLSILESLAANVPVITTNVGGNEEVIVDGENGSIYKAKDIKSLRDILEKLYLGHKKIEVNTNELIENSFSLEKMVENHFNLLLEEVKTKK